ncbi:hypothetical protein PIB30_090870 [Stylosanthes scabra]|uniref:Uncharacterized protein n=1 Tax=Stylosanthes scabra TaxID=79078 RepID=A0ABU6YS04_9FABA|nr:hypothetical protein [Stylosanthes scabra]
MVRTRSVSLAKGKAKLCQPATRASPRFAALRSNIVVQIPTPTPDVPVKEAVTSTLPPKKRQNFRMAGESSSRHDTSTPCRRSRRLAALYSVTKPVSEENVWNRDDLDYDSEPERTLLRRRREARRRARQAALEQQLNMAAKHNHDNFNNAENQNRVTLGQYINPTADSCGSTIRRPAIQANNFELKPLLVNKHGYSRGG